MAAPELGPGAAMPYPSAPRAFAAVTGGTRGGAVVTGGTRGGAVVQPRVRASTAWAAASRAWGTR